MSNLRPSYRFVTVAFLIAVTAMATLGNFAESRTFFDSVREFLGMAPTQQQPAAPEPPTGTTAPVFVAGVCDTAGPIEVEGSILGTTPTAYATLGAGFNAINAGTHTGVVTIDVCGGTTEIATAVLNASGSGSASYTSITMSPAGGAARTITGNLALPLIDLNGADNVTINGLNTGGNSLTISNTSTSATSGTSTIRFLGGATNNTITNSNIQGSATHSVSANGATVFFSTDGVTANGNDNNTISNNNIGPAGTNLSSKGILCNGSTTTQAIGNSGLIINNNNVFDFFASAVTSAGVAVNGGCNTLTISNNRFYQTGTRTWTTGASHRAIDIGNSTATSGAQGFTITGNIIGYASNSQTGTYALTGSTGSFRGISFTGITGGTISNIDGNTISNISLTGISTSGGTSGSPFMGIYISSGLVTSNNNVIGSQSTTGSLTFNSTTTATTDVYGMNSFSSDDWVTNGNQIGGITGTTAATTSVFRITGIRADTSTSKTWTASGNFIGGTIANSVQNNSTSSSASTVGISSNGTTSPISLFTGNTIRNLTSVAGTSTTSGASVIGILITIGTPNHTLSQNVIHTLTNTNASAASVVTGIQFTGSTANVVERNLIYNLLAPTTSTSAEINGIRVGGGTTTYRNNMIALGANQAIAIGAAATNSGTTGINGFNGFLGTDTFIHNSVYIGGTATSGSGASYALNGTQTANTRSFRNNIFQNSRTNSGATGKHYAVKINGTAANPSGLTINNNIYFANGTGGVFGFFNSADVANIAAWRTAVGQDVASFESNPQYLDPTNALPDLHISAINPTFVEGSGADLGVTNDYDGQTRSGLTPVDIGADAGNFTSAGDIIAPAISYTNLTNTSCANDVTLTATITDGTGVNITAGTRPRLYFKKATNSTAFNDNTNATDGWKFVEATGVGGSPFSFTTNFALLFGGAPVTGDTIQYFVVAQDTAGTPNISINTGTFAAAPTSVALTSAAFPIGGTLNSYSLTAPGLSGFVTVGALGTYPNLTGASGLFNAINTSGLSGALTVTVVDTAVAEPGTTALNQINYNGCAPGPYGVLIKPSTTATLTGSSASGLITLNAADNVTIDGSNNGSSSRDLTITNTNTGTSSAVVWLQSNGANGATNNTIKNVNIVGNSNTTTLFGIGSGSSTVATTSLGNGNNSNTFDNNNISKTQYGIYSQGASAGSKNTGNSITRNLMNTASPNNIRQGGMLVGFENSISISGNTIDGISSSSDCFGIAVGLPSISTSTNAGNEVTNATVSNNIVGSVQNTGAFGSAGITLASATSGVSTISNNVIYGVGGTATPSDFNGGIILGGGNGSSTRVYFNSVSMTGTTAGSSPIFAIAVIASNPLLDIRNNSFFNTQTTGSGVRYAIGLGYPAPYTNLTINNNSYFTSTLGTAGSFATSASANSLSTPIASTTLAAFITATSGSIGNDANSIATNPAFNTLSDLRPQLGSPLIGAGVGGTGVTLDILGATRSLTTPTIGAYENAVDVAPPAISYSALGNTISTANRALNAVTVTDASGVNGTAGTRPRVYYKKSTDANAFVGNTAGDNGWKFVEAAGSASPFDFTIDYSIINGGAVVAGDTIQYFVVAQDTASTPNVGINSGTFAAAPASVALGAAQAPIGGSINSYAIASAVSGTFYVGTGSTCGPSGTDPCTFTSLTNAGGIFQYINSNVVTGDIIIELANDLSGETGTFGLLPFASPYTLTIYPTGTGPRTIAGTGTNSAVIPIIGADRVTIDGSIGGTGTSRDLIISNSNTASGSGVVFIGSQGTGAGATNITIRNTVIRAGTIGNTTTFTFGVFIGDQTGASAGADNDNITLHNNKIMKARTAIQATGVAATGVMDNLAVTNNTIGDSVAADTIGRIGVSLSNSDAANISGNTISNLFLALDNQSATGISFAGTSNTLVSQNTITNIKSTGASTTPTGIATSSSTGSTITRNTINDIAGSNSTNPSGITIGTGAITSAVSRNTISNIAYTGTGGYAGRGITVNTGNATSALTISNNFISDIRGDSWNGIGVDHIAGILLLGTSGGIDLHHNSVNLGSGTFAGNSSGTLSTALGIASGVTALDVRGNIFANNLVNSNAAAAKAYAIYSAAPASIFSAASDRNDYYASGTQGVLGFLGGDQTTIGAWQTAVGGTVDDNSIALDPQFTSATDLHIRRAPAAYNLSPVENAGAPVAGISTDADGDTRDVSTPDIGADEVISVQLSSATYSVAENVGGGVATVTVTRTAGAATAASVSYSTADDTAINGGACTGSTDYISAVGALNFAIGETSKTFDITICNDAVYENDETILVALSSPSGAILGAPSLGTVTITNDDTAPTVSINDVEFSADSVVDTKFTVTLSAASGISTTVPYSSGGGTATGGTGCAADDDYESVSGTLTFPAGITSQEIPISICPDTVQEPTETFNLTLGTPTGATILDGVGVGTISSADSATASVSNGSLSEGNAGTSNMSFAVNLATTSSTNTTINYTLTNGTATSGSDFDGTAGSITINAGDTTGTILVSINGDTIYEADETFSVSITSPDVAIGTGTATGTIINDDAPPSTVVVNTTADTDDGFCLAIGEGNGCTLREAINAANANPDATTINFGIPGVGPFTIVPLSALPSIDQPTVIAGESQPGFASTPVVEISGISAPDGVTGIIVNGDNSTIRYLAINNFLPGLGVGLAPVSNVVIENNFIGTDVTGTVAASNSEGINANFAVNTTLSGNVISGSTNTAIGGGWNGGLISNNRIGTDRFGTSAIPNGDDGLFITGISLSILDNVISGNLSTGLILGPSSTNSIIRGNFIGTDALGTAIIGNGDRGVEIGGSGNIIGGSGVGHSNIIANNSGNGLIVMPGALNNSVRANSIRANSALGIDLGNDGISTNDPNDGDSGPNNLQNFPVITLAEVTGSTKHIVGTLNSTPSTTFAIDVYGNTSCDSSGYGEGQTYIGTFNVTTDASGDASFDVTSLNPIVGSFLTATATDPSGNTSEFSACQQVVSGTAGTIQFSSPTYTVGEGGGTVSFTVNRNGGTDGSVSATLSASDGTAVAPGDYSAFASTTVTFADGDNTPQTFNITINEDSIYETGETINLALTSTTINLTGETATVTITDNDTAPVINSNNVTFAEGSGGGTTNFTFDLTKVGDTEVNATVNWAAVVGTASSADFSVVSATPITFLPGETTKQVTVIIVRDDIYEIDETFTLDISGGTNATAGTDGSGTISNDDAAPTISVNDVEFVGQSVVDTKFTVTLTGSSEVTATVNYDTNGITATRGASCTGSADFVRSNGTLTFLAGETSKEVTIVICPDTIVEPTETFSIDLSTPGHSTISDTQGIGTISSDDASSASVAGVSANETNSGTTTFAFPVTLTNPVSTDVTINYSTADVTANAGSDYVGVVSGSIVIPALSTSGTINITVNGDQLFEPTETFSVTITSPDVSIGTGTATGTITNDDTVPTLAFSSATYSGTEGNTATITVNRTGAPENVVSVQYATSDGTANAGVCGSGGDYVSASGTLNFAANQMSQTFSVTLCNDLLIETGETVNLSLATPGGGAALGLSAAVLTINNAGTGSTAISGVVTKFTGGGGLQNVTMTLSNGSSTLTTTTNASGAYSFSGLPDNENYSITPSCPSNPTCLGYVFDPSYREYLNLSGSVTDANFVSYLGDNPRDISVVNTVQATYASNVTVPITVASRGNENSFLFTLNFDPARLQYSSVSCGAAPPAGCTAFGSPGVGSVAISVDLAPGVTFSTGLRQVALVTFTTTPGTAFNTPVSFASSPRSVENVDGIAIPADYINGSVIFAQGLEGDVAGCPSSPNCIGVPANSGYPDGLVNSGDLTRLRRLVAGFSTPNSSINEFQRADIAPFVGRGDGRFTSGDVTVMRRYISGDLSTVRVPASGPVTLVPLVELPLDPTGQRDETERETPFRVIGGSAAHGENVTVAVELDQRGVENSYSYTLQFDPTRLNLANGGVRLDAMTMLGGGALTVNYDDAANGNIGILFDMPSGQVIANGPTRHTVLLTFYVPKRAPLGDAFVMFSDSVAERYLSNPAGDPIAFKFVPGVVSIVATSR